MSGNTNKHDVGIEHLIHIERKYLDNMKQERLSTSMLPHILPELDSVSLLKVTGISRYFEDELGGDIWTQAMQDLITGLSSASSSLPYVVIGREYEVDIYIGCCRFLEEAVQVTEHQPNGDIATLISALHSAYPGIYFSQQDKDQITSVQSLTFRLFWA
jgi:hypothetical protein